MKTECIRLLEWMRKKEVNIAVDEIGEFAFDIGVDNFSAETLYEKFRLEEKMNAKCSCSGNTTNITPRECCQVHG